MPIVAFEPGRTLEIPPCRDRDPMLESTVTNPSHFEGLFTAQFPPSDAIVQYRLAPHQHVTFCAPDGGILQNDGRVELSVLTPGL